MVNMDNLKAVVVLALFGASTLAGVVGALAAVFIYFVIATIFHLSGHYGEAALVGFLLAWGAACLWFLRGSRK